MKIQKNQQHNDILELNLGNLPSHTPYPEPTKLYMADNSKFFNTLNVRKSSLGSAIELDRIIDSKTFNVMPFLGEVPVQASPLFSDDILYFVTRENSVAGWNFKTDELIFNLRFLEPPARRGMALWKSDDKKSFYYQPQNFQP